MGKRLTTSEFIFRAKKRYGDKYDYSKVEYKNSRTDVVIICPTHGDFKQRPDTYLYRSKGCSKCAFNTKTTEQYIEEARIVHGDKYDYSKVEYKNTNSNVIIICPLHGSFSQRTDHHLNGSGCNLCGVDTTAAKIKSTASEEFIPKALMVHGDKYDYSKVEYDTAKTGINIICPVHGCFMQTPDHHLGGENCPKCAGVYKKNTEEFIEEARKVHGDKFDYSKVEYINQYRTIIVICPIHGELHVFPNNHLRYDCKKCKGFKETTEEYIKQLGRYMVINMIIQRLNINIQ